MRENGKGAHKFDALDQADAAVILTEWENYANIDWQKHAPTMRRPSWVFDTRSIINPKKY